MHAHHHCIACPVEQLQHATTLTSICTCALVPCTVQVVQKTWDWLAEQPEDAAELAALLFEAAPKLGVPGAQRTPGKSMSRAASRAHALDMPDVPLKQRLGAAQPMPTGESAHMPHCTVYQRQRASAGHAPPCGCQLLCNRINQPGCNAMRLLQHPIPLLCTSTNVSSDCEARPRHACWVRTAGLPPATCRVKHAQHCKSRMRHACREWGG